MSAIEIIKEVANELQVVTKSLIEEPIKLKNRFQTISMAILRKNHYSLYSLLYLSEDEYTGDAILDISRRMLEDMVSLEYMKAKGKEKMAEQFINFLPIESKLDLDFIKSFGLHANKDLIEAVEKEFEEVKVDFTFKKGEMSKTWSKCNFEQMLNYLLKNKVFNQLTKDMVLQGYIFGNRKNHLSPKDLVSYMHSKFRVSNLSVSRDLGLLFGTITCLQIAKDYAIEIENKDAQDKLEKLSMRVKKLE